MQHVANGIDDKKFGGVRKSDFSVECGGVRARLWKECGASPPDPS